MTADADLIDADDGLPGRASGAWAQDKLAFLRKYADIFSTGMKYKWPTRVYVDLMAGPGVCVDRKSHLTFEGSPLLAQRVTDPFSRTVFVERDPAAVAALETRLRRVGATRAIVLRGDCNDPAVVAGVKQVIDDGLALVFVDLIGLNVRFDTIRRLTEGQAVDLVVTFPDMALKRNFPQAEAEEWTAFFGGTAWREALDRWARHTAREGSVSAMLANVYRRELDQQLGYRHSTCARPMVNSRRAVLYRPLFASRHTKGLEFWQKISRRDRSGQPNLFD
jgi:three-Cys-motif partner protein